MNNLPTMIIIAGGLGTRLKILTKEKPKSMVDINKKPFIFHQLNLLKKNNIENVIICTGHISESIKSYVGNGKKFGLNVTYSDDGKNLIGTGGALKKSSSLVEGPFFSMYGDSYLDINFEKIYSFYKNNNKVPLMTIFKNNDNWDKSNISYVDNKIVSYKKKLSGIDMNYIDYGLSIMSSKDINSIEREKFDMSLLYNHLLNNNNLIGYKVFERFYEVGSLLGINDLELYLKSKTGELNE